MGFEVKGRDVEMCTDHHFRPHAREDERDGESQGRETDAEGEHVNNAVVTERNLLRDIIKPQAKGGYKG